MCKLSPVVVSPYCGFPCEDSPNFTQSKFEIVEKEGKSVRVRVSEPVKFEIPDDLLASDFSIKVVKESGLLDKLSPCAKIKISPLAQQDEVHTAVSLLEDDELRLKVENKLDKKIVVKSEPQPEPNPEPQPEPEPSK